MPKLFRQNVPERDLILPKKSEASSEGRKTNNGEAMAGIAIVCWVF